ncbi:MAG: two-component system sensor histidine kinase NtrB [Anaerolineales bacterium]
MKIASQVRIFPNLIGSLELADVALLLEQIPQPAFLINADIDQILLANAKACKLSQRTIDQLQELSLSYVFSNLSVKQDRTIPFPLRLITANGTTVRGKARLHALPKSDHLLLLVFIPIETSFASQKHSEWSDKFFITLDWVSYLLSENSLLTLFSRLLQDLMELSASENGYLYTALVNQTYFSCVTCKEMTTVFPSQLSLADLPEINAPSIWTDRQSPKTRLAYLAQQNGQRFLITLPLGEPHARIGLILLCSREEYCSPFSLADWAALDNYLSTLVQFFYQTRNLEKELSIQAHENSVYRRLLNSIQEGVLFLSHDQRILFINSAAETIFGYTLTEVLDQPIQTFLISERDFSSTLQTTLQDRLRNQIRSIRLYRRSGQSFLADLQFIPLRIDQKVNGVAILIQDRTEQEALLKQSMRMEQRAVLGEFTALFAHEARNPINNITANLQWMSLNLPADDPNQATIQRIQQNCERLNDLMETILTYNRISEMEMETLDIKSLLKKVLDRQSIHLQQANIRLNYQTSEKVPTIRGNRRALERVFANLIDNAVHSMKEKGGDLTVKIQTSGATDGREEWLEVSIADSGPGIPEEYQDKLFKESFTTKSNGSGIGLMICHKMIQAHKGTIDYQSVPGGTAFIVRLPLNSTS